MPWQLWAGGAGIALACLFWWWLTRTLRRLGAAQRDLAVADANMQVKNEQLQIAADRPDANGVDRRLRDGTF